MNGDLNFIFKPEWFIVYTNLRYVPEIKIIISLVSQRKNENVSKHTYTQFVESAYGTDTQQNLKDGLISVTYKLN